MPAKDLAKSESVFFFVYRDDRGQAFRLKGCSHSLASRGTKSHREKEAIT